MSVSSRYRTNQFDTTQLAAAGVAGTVFPGKTLDTKIVEPGTLMARCVATIVTGALTFAPSWQVSDDALTWENVKVTNNAANVAITATSTLHLESPNGVCGKRYCRSVFTSAGATAAAGDFYRFSYAYRLADAV